MSLSNNVRFMAVKFTEELVKVVEAVEDEPGVAELVRECLSRMPPQFSVRISVEAGEEDGHLFICASLMEAPPEDGWLTRGDRFGGVGPQPCEEMYKFDEACRSSITALPGDPKFWNLLAGMLVRRF